MFEFLKDSFEALGQRIRSPFLGSIALVFVALNWKALIYLAFSNKTLEERFVFFDCNTTAASLYIKPIFFGIILAILAPWLKLLGAFLAKLPKELLDKLQHDQAQVRRIYEIEQSEKEERAEEKLQAIREQRKIDAAKRLEEANTVSDEVGKEIIEERKQSVQGKHEEVSNKLDIVTAQVASLSRQARYLFDKATSEPEGRVRLIDEGSYVRIITGSQRGKADGRKEVLEFFNAMNKLIELGILVGKNHDAKMTRFGYKVAEKLSEMKEDTKNDVNEEHIKE